MDEIKLNEDYYAGKNDCYKEKDNLIFKRCAMFGKGKRKDRLAEAEGAVMSLYLQNQSILSSMRHMHDEIELLHEEIRVLYSSLNEDKKSKGDDLK